MIEIYNAVYYNQATSWYGQTVIVGFEYGCPADFFLAITADHLLSLWRYISLAVLCVSQDDTVYVPLTS